MLRRHLLATILLGAATATTTVAQTPAPAVDPLLTRIKSATIGVPSVAQIEELYGKWLDFKVQERGTVSEGMAKSWGTPKTSGRKFITMHSAGTKDVYIRAIEVDSVPGYKAMTTWGWNSIELIVEDPDKAYEKLTASPFRHVGGPANLGGGASSIRAVQFAGPAEEVLYLTAETGDRSKSTLPIPQSFIDRPFILILAGPDAMAISKFYTETFLMGGYPPRPTPINIIAQAQGLPADHQFQLGLARAQERGNNIEIDGYPSSTKQRPRADGQLPPGNAMATFSVNSLDGLRVKFIAEPVKLSNGRRVATFVGPAGELTELIEEPR